MTLKLSIPAGIDDPKTRALVGLLDRWDELPVEKVLVWHLESAQDDAVPLVAELLGLTGPEFQGAAPPVDLVKQGVVLRRRKGVPWALREVLRRLGFGEVELTAVTARKYDGTIKYDGEWRYGADAHWAIFAIFFDVAAPLTTAQVRARWDAVAAWKGERDWFVMGIRQPGQPTVMHWTRP